MVTSFSVDYLKHRSQLVPDCSAVECHIALDVLHGYSKSLQQKSCRYVNLSKDARFGTDPVDEEVSFLDRLAPTGVATRALTKRIHPSEGPSREQTCHAIGVTGK
jgi:hypothetical protein